MSGGGSSQVTATNVTAPTIDISDAINSILKSAEVLVPSLQSAGINLASSLGQSNSLLAGYGQVANNATTLQQQLLGMTPVDLNGQQMQQQVQQMRQAYISSGIPIDKATSDLFSQVDSNVASAVGLKDPVQRQAAYQQALQSFQSLQAQLSKAPEAVKNAPVQVKDPYTGNNKPIPYAQAQALMAQHGISGSLAPQGMDASSGYMPAVVTNNGIIGGEGDSGFVSYSQFADYLKQQGATLPGATTEDGGSTTPDPNQLNQQYAAQVQDLMQNFQYNYDANATQKMSNADITKMIQTNPEYVANYESGVQTIQRMAAAGGMLSSGNTLKAAADFGSQLSGTVYGNLYDRTAALAGQTQGVAATAASNQMTNAGTSYQAQVAPAQARSSALATVGNLQGQTAIQQAQLQAQAAIANQQAQLNASMQNAQTNASNSSGIGQIAGVIGGGLLRGAAKTSGAGILSGFI